MEQEKLRIHKTKYRNRGMANKKLKGANEIHVIFKFDTDEKATDFIVKVKEWYYGLEKVSDKIIKAIRDETPETAIARTGGISNKESTKVLDNAMDKFNKQTDESKTDPDKKPDLHSKETIASNNSFDNLNNAFNELKKNEPKTPEVKKPATKKRKTGRSPKKNIQGQKR